MADTTACAVDTATLYEACGEVQGVADTDVSMH
jgi:hypothetical protein